MAMIGSDGLSLRIGDGAVAEIFNPLNGAVVKRLEITQRLYAANAVHGDAWVAQGGVGERRAIIECEAYATDDAAALRLRSLAMSGDAGNIQLTLRTAETLSAAVYVTRYEEITEAGQVKRLSCRMESSGALTLS